MEGEEIHGGEVIGDGDVSADVMEKGSLSPLTGSYLLIVLAEPHSEEDREIILQRLNKGLLSWDVDSSHVDLNCELLNLTNSNPEGDEARNGEKLVQWASENLVVEVLIHSQVNTLQQCMKNLLASFTRHRHIIHAGYTFQGSGSWVLQDGTFSLSDYLELWGEGEVQRILAAYKGDISVSMHCASENGWTQERLCKEPFAKLCQITINPEDKMSQIHNSGIGAFSEFISKMLIPSPIKEILEPSDIVGNIRFSHPTLYVFPGGQGDAALFGINGFNMLIDGGFARKACFWDFTRHLDRLDAVLLTRINNNSVGGLSSVIQRKVMNQVYPQIGHFFGNIIERKGSSEDKKDDSAQKQEKLLVSLNDEGHRIVENLRNINLRPHLCFRETHIEPINLYHKVGHGKLDLYVLNPAKDSREVKEFLSKWNSDCKSFVSSRMSSRTADGKEFQFPILNLVSICALIVWQPANPRDPITRILFPGSTPQHKIFEALGKLKHLEFLRYPVCTAKTIAASHRSQAKSEKVISEAKEQLSKVGGVGSHTNVQTIHTSSTDGSLSKTHLSKTSSTSAVHRSSSHSKVASASSLKEDTTSIISKERSAKRAPSKGGEDSNKIQTKSSESPIQVKRQIRTTSKSTVGRVPSSIVSKESRDIASKDIATKDIASKDTKEAPKKKDVPAGKKISPTSPGRRIESKVKSLSKLAKDSPPQTPPKSAKDANNRRVIEHKSIKSKTESQQVKPLPRVDIKKKVPPAKSSIPTSTASKSPVKKSIPKRTASGVAAAGATAAAVAVARRGSKETKVARKISDDQEGAEKKIQAETNGSISTTKQESPSQEDIHEQQEEEHVQDDQPSSLQPTSLPFESGSELSSLDHISVQEETASTSDLSKEQFDTETLQPAESEHEDEEEEYLIVEKDESTDNAESERVLTKTLGSLDEPCPSIPEDKAPELEEEEDEDKISKDELPEAEKELAEEVSKDSQDVTEKEEIEGETRVEEQASESESKKDETQADIAKEVETEVNRITEESELVRSKEDQTEAAATKEDELEQVKSKEDELEQEEVAEKAIEEIKVTELVSTEDTPVSSDIPKHDDDKVEKITDAQETSESQQDSSQIDEVTVEEKLVRGEEQEDVEKAEKVPEKEEESEDIVPEKLEKKAEEEAEEEKQEKVTEKANEEITEKSEEKAELPSHKSEGEVTEEPEEKVKPISEKSEAKPEITTDINEEKAGKEAEKLEDTGIEKAEEEAEGKAGKPEEKAEPASEKSDEKAKIIADKPEEKVDEEVFKSEDKVTEKPEEKVEAVTEKSEEKEEITTDKPEEKVGKETDKSEDKVKQEPEDKAGEQKEVESEEKRHAEEVDSTMVQEDEKDASEKDAGDKASEEEKEEPVKNVLETESTKLELKEVLEPKVDRQSEEALLKEEYDGESPPDVQTEKLSDASRETGPTVHLPQSDQQEQDKLEDEVNKEIGEEQQGESGEVSLVGKEEKGKSPVKETLREEEPPKEETKSSESIKAEITEKELSAQQLQLDSHERPINEQEETQPQLDQYTPSTAPTDTSKEDLPSQELGEAQLSRQIAPKVEQPLEFESQRETSEIALDGKDADKETQDPEKLTQEETVEKKEIKQVETIASEKIETTDSTAEDVASKKIAEAAEEKDSEPLKSTQMISTTPEITDKAAETAEKAHDDQETVGKRVDELDEGGQSGHIESDFKSVEPVEEPTETTQIDVTEQTTASAGKLVESLVEKETGLLDLATEIEAAEKDAERKDQPSTMKEDGIKLIEGSEKSDDKTQSDAAKTAETQETADDVPKEEAAPEVPVTEEKVEKVEARGSVEKASIPEVKEAVTSETLGEPEPTESLGKEIETAEKKLAGIETADAVRIADEKLEASQETGTSQDSPKPADTKSAEALISDALDKAQESEPSKMIEKEIEKLEEPSAPEEQSTAEKSEVEQSEKSKPVEKEVPTGPGESDGTTDKSEKAAAEPEAVLEETVKVPEQGLPIDSSVVEQLEAAMVTIENEEEITSLAHDKTTDDAAKVDQKDEKPQELLAEEKGKEISAAEIFEPEIISEKSQKVESAIESEVTKDIEPKVIEDLQKDSSAKSGHTETLTEKHEKTPEAKTPEPSETVSKPFSESEETIVISLKSSEIEAVIEKIDLSGDKKSETEVVTSSEKDLEAPEKESEKSEKAQLLQESADAPQQLSEPAPTGVKDESYTALSSKPEEELVSEDKTQTSFEVSELKSETLISEVSSKSPEPKPISKGEPTQELPVQDGVSKVEPETVIPSETVISEVSSQSQEPEPKSKEEPCQEPPIRDAVSLIEPEVAIPSETVISEASLQSPEPKSKEEASQEPTVQEGASEVESESAIPSKSPSPQPEPEEVAKSSAQREAFVSEDLLQSDTTDDATSKTGLKIDTEVAGQQAEEKSKTPEEIKITSKIQPIQDQEPDTPITTPAKPAETTVQQPVTAQESLLSQKADECTLQSKGEEPIESEKEIIPESSDKSLGKEEEDISLVKEKESIPTQKDTPPEKRLDPEKEIGSESVSGEKTELVLKREEESIEYSLEQVQEKLGEPIIIASEGGKPLQDVTSELSSTPTACIKMEGEHAGKEQQESKEEAKSLHIQDQTDDKVEKIHEKAQEVQEVEKSQEKVENILEKVEEKVEKSDTKMEEFKGKVEEVEDKVEKAQEKSGKTEDKAEKADDKVEKDEEKAVKTLEDESEGKRLTQDVEHSQAVVEDIQRMTLEELEKDGKILSQPERSDEQFNLTEGIALGTSIEEDKVAPKVEGERMAQSQKSDLTETEHKMKAEKASEEETVATGGEMKAEGKGVKEEKEKDEGEGEPEKEEGKFIRPLPYDETIDSPEGLDKLLRAGKTLIDKESSKRKEDEEKVVGVPSALAKLPRESREVIRTPDEVADLPVHEEVEPGTYETDELIEEPDTEEYSEEDQGVEALGIVNIPQSPSPQKQLEEEINTTQPTEPSQATKPVTLPEIAPLPEAPADQAVTKIDAAVSPVLESLLGQSPPKTFPQAPQEMSATKKSGESSPQAILLEGAAEGSLIEIESDAKYAAEKVTLASDSKIETLVTFESKTETLVKSESKAESQVRPESKTKSEIIIESDNKADIKDTESKLEAVLDIKTKDDTTSAEKSPTEKSPVIPSSPVLPEGRQLIPEMEKGSGLSDVAKGSVEDIPLRPASVEISVKEKAFEVKVEESDLESSALTADAVGIKVDRDIEAESSGKEKRDAAGESIALEERSPTGESDAESEKASKERAAGERDIKGESDAPDMTISQMKISQTEVTSSAKQIYSAEISGRESVEKELSLNMKPIASVVITPSTPPVQILDKTEFSYPQESDSPASSHAGVTEIINETQKLVETDEKVQKVEEGLVSSVEGHERKLSWNSDESSTSSQTPLTAISKEKEPQPPSKPADTAALDKSPIEPDPVLSSGVSEDKHEELKSTESSPKGSKPGSRRGSKVESRRSSKADSRRSSKADPKEGEKLFLLPGKDEEDKSDVDDEDIYETDEAAMGAVCSGLLTAATTLSAAVLSQSPEDLATLPPFIPVLPEDASSTVAEGDSAFVLAQEDEEGEKKSKITSESSEVLKKAESYTETSTKTESRSETLDKIESYSQVQTKQESSSEKQDKTDSYFETQQISSSSKTAEVEQSIHKTVSPLDTEISRSAVEKASESTSQKVKDILVEETQASTTMEKVSVSALSSEEKVTESVQKLSEDSIEKSTDGKQETVKTSVVAKASESVHEITSAIQSEKATDSFISQQKETTSKVSSVQKVTEGTGLDKKEEKSSEVEQNLLDKGEDTITTITTEQSDLNLIDEITPSTSTALGTPAPAPIITAISETSSTLASLATTESEVISTETLDSINTSAIPDQSDAPGIGNVSGDGIATTRSLDSTSRSIVQESREEEKVPVDNKQQSDDLSLPSELANKLIPTESEVKSGESSEERKASITTELSSSVEQHTDISTDSAEQEKQDEEKPIVSLSEEIRTALSTAEAVEPPINPSTDISPISTLITQPTSTTSLPVDSLESDASLIPDIQGKGGELSQDVMPGASSDDKLTSEDKIMQDSMVTETEVEKAKQVVSSVVEAAEEKVVEKFQQAEEIIKQVEEKLESVLIETNQQISESTSGLRQIIIDDKSLEEELSKEKMLPEDEDEGSVEEKAEGECLEKGKGETKESTETSKGEHGEKEYVKPAAESSDLSLLSSDLATETKSIHSTTGPDIEKPLEISHTQITSQSSFTYATDAFPSTSKEQSGTSVAPVPSKRSSITDEKLEGQAKIPSKEQSESLEKAETQKDKGISKATEKEEKEIQQEKAPSEKEQVEQGGAQQQKEIAEDKTVGEKKGPEAFTEKSGKQILTAEVRDKKTEETKEVSEVITKTSRSSVRSEINLNEKDSREEGQIEGKESEGSEAELVSIISSEIKSKESVPDTQTSSAQKVAQVSLDEWSAEKVAGRDGKECPEQHEDTVESKKDDGSSRVEETSTETKCTSDSHSSMFTTKSETTSLTTVTESNIEKAAQTSSQTTSLLQEQTSDSTTLKFSQLSDASQLIDSSKLVTSKTEGTTKSGDFSKAEVISELVSIPKPADVSKPDDGSKLVLSTAKDISTSEITSKLEDFSIQGASKQQGSTKTEESISVSGSSKLSGASEQDTKTRDSKWKEESSDVFTSEGLSSEVSKESQRTALTRRFSSQEVSEKNFQSLGSRRRASEIIEHSEEITGTSSTTSSSTAVGGAKQFGEITNEKEILRTSPGGSYYSGYGYVFGSAADEEEEPQTDEESVYGEDSQSHSLSLKENQSLTTSRTAPQSAILTSITTTTTTTTSKSSDKPEGLALTHDLIDEGSYSSGDFSDSQLSTAAGGKDLEEDSLEASEVSKTELSKQESIHSKTEIISKVETPAKTVTITKIETPGKTEIISETVSETLSKIQIPAQGEIISKIEIPARTEIISGSSGVMQIISQTDAAGKTGTITREIKELPSSETISETLSKIDFPGKSEMMKQIESLSKMEITGKPEILSTFDIPGKADILTQFEIPGKGEFASKFEIPGKSEILSQFEIPGKSEMFSKLGILDEPETSVSEKSETVTSEDGRTEETTTERTEEKISGGIVERVTTTTTTTTTRTSTKDGEKLGASSFSSEFAFASTSAPSSSSRQKEAEDEDIVKAWGKPLGLPPVQSDEAAPHSNEPESSGSLAKGTPKKDKSTDRKNPGTPAKTGHSSSSRGRTHHRSSKNCNPIYVDLAYVPHHGNSNYCDSEFFRLIRARYYVFSGLEPSRQVFDGLLQGKQAWDDKNLEVTIIPTYDTDTLGYWVVDSEDALAEARIDLAPSASRCTINLQDHETSCSAYRLEF